MNRKAREIGAKNTNFKNPHGLPASGQYTTASDLSKIMTHALTYPRLRDIMSTRVVKLRTENGNAIFLKNTNKLLWSEDNLIGGKTGYTRKARHCFVGAAERGESTVVVAVLGSPNRKTLWKESEKLFEEGFEVMTNGKHRFIHSAKSTKGTKKNSYVKHTKYQEKASKADDMRKAVAKKIARDKKPQIGRRQTETVKTSRDKREKNYRIAEKLKIDNKG
jgi:D-alanyl-D-alanine carboxypeptidase (penicillin-binding protein 5/6)